MHVPRMLLFALAIVSTGCANEPPTSPRILQDGVSTSVTQNEWETWQIAFPPDQCVAGFKTGSVDVHLVSTSRVLKDGSIETRVHLNSRNGSLTDAAGNEYVFGHNSKFGQVMTTTNTYVAEATDRFRVVSKGAETNEFVEIMVRIEWDGSQFNVT